MTTTQRNSKLKMVKRRMADVLPDDIHLDIFSDTMIEKSEYGDTLAVIKDVSTYYKKLSLIPERSFFSFNFFARSQTAPPAVLAKIESASSVLDLLSVYRSIGNRTYSTIRPMTYVQCAQVQNIAYRAKLVQEGLTKERNRIQFEKRHPVKSEELLYANPIFRDVYDEALEISKDIQQYNPPKSLGEFTTSVIFQISGVFKNIVVLPISSPMATSIFIPMLVNMVLGVVGIASVPFATAAIIGVNFIINLSPAYMKYMDQRKYEEDTSTLMALVKIVANASYETFFVTAVTTVSGFVFADGYLKIGAGLLLPVIGRCVFSSEYKNANIKAAMQTTNGVEELRLKNELIKKNRNLKEFWRGTAGTSYFTENLTWFINKVDWLKNFTFSIPVFLHKFLYKTRIYKAVVDTTKTFWEWGPTSPVSCIVRMFSKVYEKTLQPVTNFVSDKLFTIVQDTVLERKVRELCHNSGITFVFERMVEIGRGIVTKVYSIGTTIAQGMPGFSWKFISLAGLAIIGIFFSDAINAIPPHSLAQFLTGIPLWLYFGLTHIASTTCYVVMTLLEAMGLHKMPIATWNLVSGGFLAIADFLHVLFIQNIAKPIDNSILGRVLSNLMAGIATNAHNIVVNSIEYCIANIQDTRNWIFSQTHLQISGLIGCPETVKLGMRLTSLGISTAFFSAMVIGMSETPAFLYKTYEKIVLTHIKVIGLCTSVIGGILLVLTYQGVTLASISPLAVLQLALGWIQTNYLNLVPGASSELYSLLHSYIIRVAESEDIILFFRGCVTSQACGIVMSGLRSNLGLYVSVYLPFVTTMLYQDLTGVELEAWVSFSIALASGIVAYTWLPLMGNTRFGIKLKQCAAAIQSISIASTFQQTNFLFKWYVLDSDILDTTFTEMFKWLFLEVYTSSKINIIVQRLGSQFVFNKEVFVELTPEQVEKYTAEDKKATKAHIDQLDRKIQSSEAIVRNKNKEAHNELLHYPASGKEYSKHEMSLLEEMNQDSDTTTGHYQYVVETLGKINPTWKQKYESITGQSAEVSAAILNFRAQIEVANSFHDEFVSMLTTHRVNPFSVTANGIINEMAFWRTPDPAFQGELVDLGKKFADNIESIQMEMQEALGTTYKDVENVLQSTRSLRNSVVSAVDNPKQSIQTKIENIAELNFAEQYNILSELNAVFKREIAENENLHRLDRKLELLQSRAVHFMMGEASKKGSFNDLEVLKKEMLKNSFVGTMADKLNLAISTTDTDLKIALRNALSLHPTPRVKNHDVFVQEVFHPLMEKKFQEKSELIVRMKEARERQDRFIELAETTLLSRYDLETRDSDNYFNNLYRHRQAINPGNHIFTEESKGEILNLLSKYGYQPKDTTELFNDLNGFLEKNVKSKIEMASDANFYRDVVAPTYGDGYKQTADLLTRKIDEVEKGLRPVNPVSDSNWLARSQSKFSKTLGFSEPGDLVNVENNFGHAINLDKLGAIDIFAFSEEQRKRLSGFDREILKFARLEVDLRPKLPPTSLIPTDTSELNSLSNSPMSNRESGVMRTSRRGFLIPILPTRGAMGNSSGPAVTVTGRKSLIVSPNSMPQPMGDPRQNGLIELASLGQDRTYSRATEIETTTKFGLDIETITKTGRATSTSIKFSDEVPQDNPDRSSVFESVRAPLDERPQAAPTILTEGLLTFKQTNGLYKLNRLSNWYRSSGILGSNVHSIHSRGVGVIPGFVKILDEWSAKIKSLPLHIFMNEENRDWVEKNITLMAYSNEFSDKLARIELTPEILRSVYAVNSHFDNVNLAFDEIVANTGKPMNAANPLFLWTISESRPPPYISNINDPYENVRKNLLERATKLGEINSAIHQDRLNTQLVTLRQLLNSNIDVTIKQGLPLPTEVYGPDSMRNYKVVNTAMEVATAVKDTTLNALEYTADLASRGINYGIKGVVGETVFSAIGYPISWFGSLVSTTVSAIVSAAAPTVSTVAQTLLPAFEGYPSDYSPFIDPKEQQTRFEFPVLEALIENMPVETRQKLQLDVHVTACRKAMYDIDLEKKRAFEHGFRIPYEGITGLSPAGQVLQYADYQDLDNRYLPKENMILAENFQYKPDVMSNLFKSAGLVENNEYKGEIGAWMTSYNFDRLRKLQSPNRDI